MRVIKRVLFKRLNKPWQIRATVVLIALAWLFAIMAVRTVTSAITPRNVIICISAVILVKTTLKFMAEKEKIRKQERPKKKGRVKVSNMTASVEVAEAIREWVNENH